MTQRTFEVSDEQIDGDDYFAVIEPVFLAVSIYDGPEIYELNLKPFSEEQRNVLACHWYLSEVNNGGHDQFFDNNTGIVWRDAKSGFLSIGAQEISLLIEQAASRLGGNPSLVREERQQQLEAHDCQFDDLDQQLFALEKKIDLNEKLLNYIRKHRTKVYFSGQVDDPRT
jgi:hypothetical protein